MLEPRKPGEPALVTLGCMNFGKRTPAPESERIVARALERGVTLFDTANVYNDGESERILGRALRAAGARARSKIATKVGLARVAGRPEGLSREAIHRAIDESLGRLGTDHVDVYYLHAPDHAVPIEETLGAMEELRAAGKIGALGVSNYAAWQILEMMGVPGAPRPAVSQVMYNLLIRQIEIEYVGFTRRYPIHTTVYNPLAGGLLTGQHAGAGTGEPPHGSRFDKNRMYQGRYWSPAFFAQVDAYRALAAELGTSLAALSYGWLAAQPHVDSILAGPGSVEHLDAALDGVATVIPAAALGRIDEIHRAHTGTDASYVR
jgi:aryl-alcohol dehydrogenase-like predicted oxidoreductase